MGSLMISLNFFIVTADDFDWYGYLTADLEPLQSQFSDSTVKIVFTWGCECVSCL